MPRVCCTCRSSERVALRGRGRASLCALGRHVERHDFVLVGAEIVSESTFGVFGGADLLLKLYAFALPRSSCGLK